MPAPVAAAEETVAEAAEETVVAIVAAETAADAATAADQTAARVVPVSAHATSRKARTGWTERVVSHEAALSAFCVGQNGVGECTADA